MYSNHGNGVRRDTYKLDDATLALVKAPADPVDICGKGVALTASKVVGFGAEAGTPLFGVVQTIDVRDGMVAVAVTGTLEGLAGKEGTLPTLGEVGLGVDNAGNIMKLTAGKRGIVVGIEGSTLDITL